MQLERVLKGHLQSITSLHLLDDGILASNSIDSQVKLWDIKDISNNKKEKKENDDKEDVDEEEEEVNEYYCIRTLEGISNNVVVFPDGVMATLSVNNSNNKQGARDAQTQSKQVKLWDAFEGRCFMTLDDARGCESLMRLNDGVFVTVSSREVVGWNKRGETVFTLWLGGTSLPDCVIGLQKEDAVAMVNLRQKSVSVWNILDKFRYLSLLSSLLFFNSTQLHNTI